MTEWQIFVYLSDRENNMKNVTNLSIHVDNEVQTKFLQGRERERESKKKLKRAKEKVVVVKSDVN